MYCSKSNLTLYTYLNCHKSVSNCVENLRVVNFEKTNPPIVKDVFYLIRYVYGSYVFQDQFADYKYHTALIILASLITNFLDQK